MDAGDDASGGACGWAVAAVDNALGDAPTDDVLHLSDCARSVAAAAVGVDAAAVAARG